jgi:hypothetical protein
MIYRVILIANGIYKKTLHTSKTIETAYLKFHSLKEENKIMFPKKFINTNGIKPVKFEICVTKTTEEDDKFRILRDDYGKLFTEKPIGDWTILISDLFDVEEKFWIYGMDNSKKDRLTITSVVKKLMTGAHAKKMVKQIIVVHNKLIIHNEDQFEMIICKNILDAQRLHHTLARIAKKQKIKSLLFLGTATPGNISRMYEIIHEETGWPYRKIRRTSTRP